MLTQASSCSKVIFRHFGVHHWRIHLLRHEAAVFCGSPTSLTARKEEREEWMHDANHETMHELASSIKVPGAYWVITSKTHSLTHYKDYIRV